MLVPGTVSRAGLGSAAIIIVLMTGCAGGPIGSSPSPPPLISATSPSGIDPGAQQATRLLVSTNKSGDAFNALISGRLGVDAAGCVILGKNVLVATPGSRLLTGGTEVSLRGVGVFRLGDMLPPTQGGYEEAIDRQRPARSDFRGCSSEDFAVITL